MLRGGGRIDAGLALIDHHLKLLDVTLRHDAGVSTLQFAFGVEFVLGLLKGRFRLLNLGFGPDYVGFPRRSGRLDFGYLAFGGFERRLLLGAVQREQHVALLHRLAEPTLTSATRPDPSGRIGTVLKYSAAVVVEGWK